jgi:sugar lactone lactonase YvrE
MSAPRDHGLARLVLDARAVLGECPLWSVAEQKLYWVDISGRAIHRYDPATGADTQWAMPCEPGCIAFARAGGLVAALRDGFYRLDPATGALHKVAEAPYDPAGMRFNDGRCDGTGRFWAGAMLESRATEGASMYCLERGAVREGWGPSRGLGVKVSNGLAFALDGRTVFQSDTSNHVIYCFDFDPASGAVANRRVFARAADDRKAPGYGGRPDGAAIDVEGGYWSAQYEGARVLRYGRDGEVRAMVRVPVRRPTMIAFGGPAMRTLFITSAREGAGEAELAEFPHSGGLFACEVDVAGRPEPAYEGD